MSVGCCIASVAASVTAASVRVAVANRSPASIAVDRVVVVALLRVVEGARRGAIARARGIVVVVASVIASRRIARVVVRRASIAIRDRPTVSARIETR
jgi:hypothetical protein